MTIIGTWYPGSLYIGWAQMGVDMGVVNTYLVFYTLGGLFILYIIASPLWKAGKRYNIKTMGEFFEKRYGSRVLRTFSGGAALLIELPWVITEMLAAGYAVQALSYGRIPFNVGMIIVAVLFTSYIVFAGMRAVIIADFYQGWMFLLGGLVLFLVSVKVFFGGFGSLFEEVRMIDQELLRLPGSAAGWGGEAPGPLFWPSLIIMGIAGAYMWPSLFARIFAASSTKEIKASAKFTPIVAVIFAFVVLLFSGESRFIYMLFLIICRSSSLKPA
jgi:SSS family solute:Na+ symporter